ncbi:hypothetical protein OUZ56_001054 [Daphnia magna]|uniref:Uncharacterized protein n=1 Tax=Daphnia magna TaxID=35525 RepID=A0ABR0A1J2_9CRUS|nr:hypothetical protein OUZ56_001054 [Daphnia magna]
MRNHKITVTSSRCSTQGHLAYQNEFAYIAAIGIQSGQGSIISFTFLFSADWEMVSQEHFTRTRRETMMMIAFFLSFLRVTYSGGLTAISVDVTNADVPVSLKEGEREHLMIEKKLLL